jgi:hypothetical protein
MISEWNDLYADCEHGNRKTVIFMKKQMHQRHKSIKKYLKENFQGDLDIRCCLKQLPTNFTLWLLSYRRLEIVCLVTVILFFILNETFLNIHTGIEYSRQKSPGYNSFADAINFFVIVFMAMVYLPLLYKRGSILNNVKNNLSQISAIAYKKI